jgi:integrase
MTDRPMPALRRRFLDDMRIKGLQPKTQTMYLRAMREFTRFVGHSPDTATPEELRAFQLDMKERGVGAPTFNNRLTVLSFFYATTCARPEMKRHMQYQRAAKKIPVVLSAAEVTRILEAAPGPGLRYRAAFSVAYGGGLRASEVTHLKIGDIDSGRMLIRIDQGKGRKDRHVMLSPSLLALLRDYYREARLTGWAVRKPATEAAQNPATGLVGGVGWSWASALARALPTKLARAKALRPVRADLAGATDQVCLAFRARLWARPVAGAVHLEDVDVVGQPVEQRAGEAFVAECAGPLVEGQVRGDDRGAALVALADQLEQAFGAGLDNGTKPSSSMISSSTPGELSSGTAAGASRPVPRSSRAR